MKFPERAKFLLIISLIVFASITGGITGNWLFIYFMNKYYQIPGGVYPASSSASVIRKIDKSQQVETILTEAVPLAERSLVGIFKTATVYIPEAKVSQGLIITNDGWVVSLTAVPMLESNWTDYAVVASDKKVYEIDKVITTNTNITFVHLKKASNLPVPDIITHRDIQVGQSVIGLEWQGTVEQGLVINDPVTIRSSEVTLDPLLISGVNSNNLFLFDLSGRVLGITLDGKTFSFDTIKSMLTKLSLHGTITYPRLGVYYLNIGNLPVESGQGALLTAMDKRPAIISDSPADKAGLRAGDIITAVDDITLDNYSDLALLLQDYNPGDRVTLTITRGKEAQRVVVALDSLK